METGCYNVEVLILRNDNSDFVLSDQGIDGLGKLER